jgi:hypothetical protein
VLFTGDLVSVVVNSICSIVDSGMAIKTNICSDGNLVGVLHSIDGASLMVEVTVRVV